MFLDLLVDSPQADKEERQKSSFAYESGASAFSAGSVGSPNGSTSSGSSLRRHVTAPEFVSADGQDGEVDKTPVRRGLNPHAGAWHGGGGGYNPPLMTAVGSPMMGGGGGGSFMPMTGANGPPPMYFSPAGFMMPPPPAAMEQHFHMGPQYFHPMHYGEAMMGGGGYFDGGMYRPPSTLWIPREGPPILPPEDKSRHPPDHRLSRQ